MTKINVAIVDDNEKMVSLLDAILQTDKNIEVIGRGDDGVQALDIIKNQEPDVVLLDLIMPKLDGLEVMQQVNKDMSAEETTRIYCDFCHWKGKHHGECF